MDLSDNPLNNMGDRKIEKLVIGKELPDEIISRISDRIPGAKVVSTRTREEQDNEIVDADVLFTRIIPEDISQARKLKWVQFMWEGIDTMSPAFRDSDMILTNAGGAHSIHIAEHVFAFLLNLSRKTRMYNDHQDRNEWVGWLDQPKLQRLFGSTIGIIGYGRLGRAVASIARGFNMRIIVLKRDPAKLKHDDYHDGTCCDIEGLIPDEIVGPDGMSYLLRNSDHVVMTLPLTGSTIGSFGRKEFKVMKETAFFVNVGRGKVVDEDSLIEVLKEKRIAGAGLDVFDTEPLSPDSPLWEMEDVIITPHSSVGGDPADDQVLAIFLENIDRFLRGDKLINVIDKSQGY